MRDERAGRGSLLEPGSNCWRIERAHRFALLIDGEHYFLALKAAMLRARRSILLIGWDFDSRVELEPGRHVAGMPSRIGAFINALARKRQGLEIRVLQWNIGAVKSLARGATPLFILDWMTSRGVRLRLDSQHPVGAAHHQKIVVIDDALAFCGGIDVTVGRWDTRAHAERELRRRSPWGVHQKPWHDAAVVFDGPAAAALGELARERWRRATGERMAQASVSQSAWPDSLQPLLREVDLAIARTVPADGDQQEALEVRQLTLDLIASVRRHLYIESQYFAAHRAVAAICARLEEPDPPEIVVVAPLSSDGWLEEAVMGPARALLLERIAAADRHGRFRIYHPVNEAGTPIYVHAKVMIVDDGLLRVGSSNLNNRSMGLDSECDIALEAGGAADREALIRAVRADLLGEHLGLTARRVEAAIGEAGGSLIAAVERLRRPAGRTLRPFLAPELGETQRALAESQLLDPERPRRFFRSARRFLRKLSR